MKDTSKYDPYDPKDYNPQAWERRKRHQGSMIVGALIVAIVSILSTVGIIKWRTNKAESLIKQTPVAVKDEVKVFSNIYLAGAFTNTALFIVGSEGVYTEIKFADTTTNTVQIQDLTRGKFQVLAAALSPSTDYVAYIREAGDHRSVEVVDRLEGDSEPVQTIKFWAATQGKTIEPCFWSPIAWSPDGGHFAFFGCTNTISMLVVVDAATYTPLDVNRVTESTHPGPRQLSWLNPTDLVYTQYDPVAETTAVNRLSSVSDAVPLVIYER